MVEADEHKTTTRTVINNDRSAYIFFNVVQATIVGNKGGDLLSILNQLNSSTLSDSRVRLFGFNTTVEM